MVAGQVVYAVSQWGLLVAVAQLGGPAMVGQFTFALAVAMPVVTFSQLQIRQILVADPSGQRRFDDYLAVRLVCTALAMVVIGGIALFSEYRNGLLAVTVLLGLAKGVESVSDVFYGLAQRHRRLNLIAQSMMLRGVLGLVALAAATAATGDLAVGLSALAMSWLVILLAFDRPRARRLTQQPESCPARSRTDRLSDYAHLARLGLPLGIALTLATLNLNVGRYFLEWSHGTATLGIFGAMAHFVVAGRMTVAAIGQAAFPRLAEHYARRDIASFRHLLMQLCLVGLAVGVAGVLMAVFLGPRVLALFYGPEFAAEGDVFVWIMAVGLINFASNPIGGALTAMHRFRVQPAILGVAVAVNVVACLILVPAFGLLGAAMAWFAAALCYALLGLTVVVRALASASASGGAPLRSI